MSGAVTTRSTGSLVAWEAGVTSTYGLKNAEERGVLFTGRVWMYTKAWWLESIHVRAI